MGVDSWEIFVEIDLETILILKFWKIFIFWCNLKDIIWGLGALHFDCENWRKDNLRFGIFSGSGLSRREEGRWIAQPGFATEIWHLTFELWTLQRLQQCYFSDACSLEWIGSDCHWNIRRFPFFNFLLFLINITCQWENGHCELALW